MVKFDGEVMTVIRIVNDAILKKASDLMNL